MPEGQIGSLLNVDNTRHTKRLPVERSNLIMTSLLARKNSSMPCLIVALDLALRPRTPRLPRSLAYLR
jgi:hypothetical protein